MAFFTERFRGRIKKVIVAEVAALTGVLILMTWKNAAVPTTGQAGSDDYIKWVDFTVSYEALCKAYEWDVETHGTEHEVHWIELLAYTAAKTGGVFDKNALKILGNTAVELSAGKADMETLTKDMKYYSYYKEVYTAVLGGMVGEYKAEVCKEDGKSDWEEKYGLKAYLPVARGFDYSHYDDFGASRSYGYKRRHLGHDMMGLTGTPNSIINYIFF